MPPWYRSLDTRQSSILDIFTAEIHHSTHVHLARSEQHHERQGYAADTVGLDFTISTSLCA